MLEGRIDMSEQEERVVAALQEELGRGALSRRDPGDTGPLLFKLRDGQTFEVEEDGTTRQVKEARRG